MVQETRAASRRQIASIRLLPTSEPRLRDLPLPHPHLGPFGVVEGHWEFSSSSAHYPSTRIVKPTAKAVNAPWNASRVLEDVEPTKSSCVSP